jgi:hypothetical protein
MNARYPALYAAATTFVKKRVARWPSAYASGQVVRKYKELVKTKHGSSAVPYVNRNRKKPLTRWFREKWIDISTGAPCGSVKSSTYYPVCRPIAIARRLTASQKRTAIAIKQRAREKTAMYPSFFVTRRGRDIDR